MDNNTKMSTKMYLHAHLHLSSTKLCVGILVFFTLISWSVYYYKATQYEHSFQEKDTRPERNVHQQRSTQSVKLVHMHQNQTERQQDVHKSPDLKQQNLEWVPPTLPDHLRLVDQTDPELIRHIKENWIIPPFSGESKAILQKQLKRIEKGEQGQPRLIDAFLKQRRNGFTVECGAADGLYNSNSLWFELNRNWSGILIEANPIYFKQILARKRHMYMINACLSPTSKPELLNFIVDGIGGGLEEFVPPGQQARRNSKHKQHTMIQCFPLYSILAAIDVSHVDYFSLDIEGAEVQVLQTIPFDLITFDSFTIEKRVVNDLKATEQKVIDIVNILSAHNYYLKQKLTLDIVILRNTTNNS